MTAHASHYADQGALDPDDVAGAVRTRSQRPAVNVVEILVVPTRQGEPAC